VTIVIAVVIMVTVMVMVLPFPAMISSPIPIAVDAFPSPSIIFLIPAPLIPGVPVVVILLRKHAAMMSCEGVAGITTSLAVVADARAVLRVASSGQSKGECREQECKRKELHFRPPLLVRVGFSVDHDSKSPLNLNSIPMVSYFLSTPGVSAITSYSQKSDRNTP